MTLETSRQFFLRFVQDTYSADAATYGSVTYGEDPFAYGQEPTETTNPSTDYDLLPALGFHPEDPGWTFRVGDENLFGCSIIDSEKPSEPIDVTPIAVAEVILTEQRFDQILPWYKRLALTPNEATNQLERTWEPGDLDKEGRFRVTVRIVFDSGRILSVEGNDSVIMQVNSSIDSAAETRGRFL
jgi:hypothetical protein